MNPNFTRSRAAFVGGLMVVVAVAVAAPSVVAQEKDNRRPGPPRARQKAPLYLGVAEMQDFSPVPVQKGFVPIMKATPTAQKDTDVLVQADVNVATTATPRSRSRTGRCWTGTTSTPWRSLSRWRPARGISPTSRSYAT